MKNIIKIMLASLLILGDAVKASEEVPLTAETEEITTIEPIVPEMPKPPEMVPTLPEEVPMVPEDEELTTISDEIPIPEGSELSTEIITLPSGME